MNRPKAEKPAFQVASGTRTRALAAVSQLSLQSVSMQMKRHDVRNVERRVRSVAAQSKLCVCARCKTVDCLANVAFPTTIVHSRGKW